MEDDGGITKEVTHLRRRIEFELGVNAWGNTGHVHDVGRLTLRVHFDERNV